MVTTIAVAGSTGGIGRASAEAIYRKEILKSRSLADRSVPQTKLTVVDALTKVLTYDKSTL
jgi:hypothetical protein